MSDRKAKQYNLRSNKQGQVYMPIHRQLCDDRKFLIEMLGKQSDRGDISSHDSNISASDSDLDCSGFVSQSENEAHWSQTDSRTYKKFATERETPSHSRDTSSLSRTLINQQVLHQLTVLSEQLDSIETASVKKTNEQRNIKIIIIYYYLGFYVAFNTVQVISRRVVGRAEETSTYSSLGFCTVNCRPSASNYQLSHLRPCWGSNPGLRGGRRECYHFVTVAPKQN